jgi:hypothetical protein
MNGKTYYLDASDKYQSFGTIPYYCYNGLSWLVDSVGRKVYLNPDSLFEENEYRVEISGLDAKFITADVTEYLGVTSSAVLRNSIAKENDALKKYVQKESHHFADNAEVEEIGKSNLEEIDSGLVLNYKIRINKDKAGNLLYFNTDYDKFYSNNPLTANKRTLPIEFIGRSNRRCSTVIKVPAGYTVEELPLASNVSIGSDMVFRHTVVYDKTQNLIRCNSDMLRSRSIFSAADYNSIRNLFDKIIQAQEQKIVIKKKN